MPVYLVLTEKSRCVKIGFTAGTARRRLAKMQTDNHERLTVIRWLEGGEDVEGALQDRYAHLRLHGDWFRFSSTMLGDLGVPDAVAVIPSKPDHPHPLGRYIAARNLTIGKFASIVGVSVQAMHRYLNGERTPHREVMVRIISATTDEVQPNDFYGNIA